MQLKLNQYLIIAVFAGWACSHPAKDKQTQADSLLLQKNSAAQYDSNLIDQKKSNHTIVIVPVHNNNVKVSDANLPFGSPELFSIQQGKRWDAKPGTDGILEESAENENEKISAYYSKINNTTAGRTPEIRQIDYMSIGNEKYCDCRSVAALDSCRYRLPDFGPYQCFYAANDWHAPIQAYCGKSCMAYGNLLLYDSASKAATALNVYFEGEGDMHVANRLFYIGENRIIHIYEGTCYDDGCGLSATFTIEVLQDGRIDLKSVKN